MGDSTDSSSSSDSFDSTDVNTFSSLSQPPLPSEFSTLSPLASAPALTESPSSSIDILESNLSLTGPPWSYSIASIASIKLSKYRFTELFTRRSASFESSLDEEAPRMSAFSSRQRTSSTNAGWVRPGSSLNMLSSKDPPNYSKRAFEGSVRPLPDQKAARLEPDTSTTSAFQRPLFSAQPFPERTAVDRKRSYGGSPFDSPDLPTGQVSESWRTNDKISISTSRSAESSYAKDSWVHTASRGSPGKNVAKADSSVWRDEAVPPKKALLTKRRNYFEEEDGNSDNEEKTRPAKLVRDPDAFTNKKKEQAMYHCIVNYADSKHRGILPPVLRTFLVYLSGHNTL
ncbi:hypothetical protein Aduo_009398 [Ancylostoma duodenale]